MEAVYNMLHLSPMWVALAVFVVSYFFIATEKIDITIAALLGGCAIVFCHVAPFEKLLEKIDLNVLGLLLGMMMIMDILSSTGVFEWLAITIARKAKGNGLLIMIELVLATAFISAFLDNVTTIILIAPITILIAQILEIPAVPILILEAIFSNIGGTATLIGDPPNIVIGSRTGLGFNDFLMHLSPVCIIIAIISAITIGVVFRKTMRSAPVAMERIYKTRPELAIIDPDNLRRGLIVFAFVMIGFFLSRMLNIEAGVIALTGAFAMALVCKVSLHKVLERMEWSTMLFFIGLFVMIGALEINGFFELAGKMMINLTQENFTLTVLVILWVSAILSAIVNNVPLIIAMIPLINSMIPVFAKQMGLEGAEEAIRIQIKEPLYWSLALGTCLGGNGTLIGASANVIVAQIAKRNRYKLSFWDFTRYGLPLMLLSMVICTFYLYFRYLAK